MTDRLVVCFCWRDRDTPPELYMRHHAVVAESMTALGGESVSWGADRYAFAFEPDCDVVTLVTAVLAALRAEATHSAGLSCRGLFDGGERQWGPALMVAEHLALSARHRELLLDTDVDAVRAGIFATVGMLSAPIGELAVEAALMVATASERPVRRTSSPPEEPTDPETVRRWDGEVPQHVPRLLDDDEVANSGVPTPVALRASNPPPGAAPATDFEESGDTEVVERPTVSDFPRASYSSIAPEEVEPSVDALFDPDASEPTDTKDETQDAGGAEAATTDLAAHSQLEGSEQSAPEEGAAANGAPADDDDADTAVALQVPPYRPSPAPEEVTRRVVAVSDEDAEERRPSRPSVTGSIPPADEIPQLPKKVGRRLSKPPPKPRTSSPPALSKPPPKPRTSSPPSRLSEPPPKPRPSVAARSTRLSEPPPKPELHTRKSRPVTQAVQPEQRPTYPGGIELQPPQLAALDDAPEASTANEADSDSDLVARLEGNAELAVGEMEAGLLRLHEAVALAAAEGPAQESRARLTLAAGLVKAGRSRQALLEAMQALAFARSAADAEGERACSRLLAQLARSADRDDIGQKWDELAQAPEPVAATEEPAADQEQPDAE